MRDFAKITNRTARIIQPQYIISKECHPNRIVINSTFELPFESAIINMYPKELPQYYQVEEMIRSPFRFKVGVQLYVCKYYAGNEAQQIPYKQSRNRKRLSCSTLGKRFPNSTHDCGEHVQDNNPIPEHPNWSNLCEKKWWVQVMHHRVSVQWNQCFITASFPETSHSLCHDSQDYFHLSDNTATMSTLRTYCKLRNCQQQATLLLEEYPM